MPISKTPGRQRAGRMARLDVADHAPVDVDGQLEAAACEPPRPGDALPEAPPRGGAVGRAADAPRRREPVLEQLLGLLLPVRAERDAVAADDQPFHARAA